MADHAMGETPMERSTRHGGKRMMEAAKSKAGAFSDVEKLLALLVAYTVGSLAVRAYWYGIDVTQVVGILNQAGIYDPPSYLVWSILFAGSVAAVVSVLTSFGIASIGWGYALALSGANSYGL